MKKATLTLFIFLIAISLYTQQWTGPDGGNTITTSYSVGIGTSNPSEKLVVYGNISTSEGDILLTNSTINQEDSGTIRWNEYNNGNPNKSGAFIRYNGDNNYLQFLTNTETTDYEHIRIYRGGNLLLQPTSGAVGIGTISTGSHKLAVEGSIGAREIKVQASGWSDFVFLDDYKLPTLQEVEDHIKKKGHLQDIPSAQDVAENGIRLGEMDARLLQKIEELTLYMISLKKEVRSLKAQNQDLQKQLNQIKSR
ncbi:hypothetical protein FGF1_27390 [Flavobacteriaceae bacterium GF1]